MISQAVRIHRLLEAERQKLVARTHSSARSCSAKYDFSTMVGSSGPMRQMYEEMARVAGDQHHGSHSGRVGYRQGADRQRDSLSLLPRQEAVHQGELCRACRRR